MAEYTINVGPTATTQDAPAATIIASANGMVRLMHSEMTWWAANANTPSFGLGRPGSVGVNPTSPVTVVPMDPSDPAGKTTMCTAWTTTNPTVPSAYFRSWTVACGQDYAPSILWYFPRGLCIPASGNLVYWISDATPVACYISIVIEE
jgi:hypothetical protein